MEFQSTHDLIIALKNARSAKPNLSLSRIEEEILLRGKSVSISTLKRVFKPGSEDSSASFSMEHTLLPIAEILLPPNDEDNEDSDDTASFEKELLKAELRVQIERVESLKASNKILEDRVSFMQTQIERKDRRMDEKDEMIRRIMAERDELRERVEELTRHEQGKETQTPQA